MPVRRKDTDRALQLLEEYCKKLKKPEEQQLKKAIKKVMGIFKSSLFQALLGHMETTAPKLEERICHSSVVPLEIHGFLTSSTIIQYFMTSVQWPSGCPPISTMNILQYTGYPNIVPSEGCDTEDLPSVASQRLCP
ncbi:disks large homolog 1-like [Alligator sinensis]|uniref:Disks large homolog 1-like n=1 Tax=Alligator sinensis TaxID=38654 RepID=A0A1U7S5B6_ALLSI|nr:disks large homolog 1-like [Alligator sinensis]